MIYLKKRLGFKSKKAVVMEGLEALTKLYQDRKRRGRLANASLAVRRQSLSVNQTWAPLSTPIKIK